MGETNTEKPWRAGDAVLHRPTGETWVLAYVWSNYPDTRRPVSDVTCPKCKRRLEARAWGGREWK